MTGTITAGSILVDRCNHLPDGLMLHSEAFSLGWATVKDKGRAFDKLVQEAGLTFFFMAGTMKRTVFGFNRKMALRSAVQRLITDVKAQHCNSIEILRVTYHSFLRMPYVTVSAHSRHLQKGASFSG